MTSKYINTAYTGGYTLSASVGTLVFGSAGSVIGAAGGFGLDVLQTAEVTNGGTLTGGLGSNASYGPSGAGGAGVYWKGDTLTNNGMIKGGAGGVGAPSGTYPYYPYDATPPYVGGQGGAGVLMRGGVITNAGWIIGGQGGPGGPAGGGFPQADSGGDGSGIQLKAGGGVVHNEAGGLIAGDFGVSDPGAGGSTIINFGTIEGISGPAVEFYSATDRLVAEAGSTFLGEGAAKLGGGTLELASGSGTISGLNGTGTISGAEALTFASFGTVQLDSGSSWTLLGANTIGSGVNLVVDGTLAIDGTLTGALALASPNARLIVESGSTLTATAAGDGGTLDFNDIAVTITGLGAGGVFTGGGATGGFSAFGTYDVYGGSSATFSGGGTIVTGKALDVGASSSATIEGGTLVSRGRIVLGTGAVLAGYAGATLDNYGVITGGGALYGTMAITNASGGLIDDDAGAMLINKQNGTALTNNGVIESTGNGDLTLKAVTVAGSGVIEDFATVKLDAATLAGGVVDVETSGVLQVSSTISNVGAGVALFNAGEIKITSGGYLYLGSSLYGDGSAFIDGVAGANAVLKAIGRVSLYGRAAVNLNADGFITGYGSTDLTSFDTISGAGAIFGTMTFANFGTIDGNGGAMLINNENGGGMTNDGLIESTGGGVLTLKDVIVNGNGSITDDHQIKLDAAEIFGGTITIGSSALLEAISGTSYLGSAVQLTNDKTLEVISGGNLIIVGAVTNDGLIETVGTGALTIGGAVTGTGSAHLTGSGNVTFDGATSQAVVFASTATGRLVLGSSSAFTGTISGLSTTGANAIDLLGVVYTTGDTTTFSGGVLTLYSSAHAVLATLKLVGTFSSFTLSNDGSGGTLIKDPPADPPASGQIAQAIAGFGGGSGTGVTHAPVAAPLNVERLLAGPAATG